MANNQQAQALEAFKALEAVYPALYPFIALHKADAYTVLGQETPLQQELSRLIRGVDHHPLDAALRYKLAQSCYRSGDTACASEFFKALSQKYPDSDYGIGSLYYLAQLSWKETPGKTSQQALAYSIDYLKKSPDGRFAVDLANTLSASKQTFTPEQHGIIGRALHQGGGDKARAIQHLSRAPFETAWRDLGEVYLDNGQGQQGVDTLLRGLKYARDLDESQESLDKVLIRLPESDQVHLLNTLNQQGLPVGRDYVLWRLARIQPARASVLYKELVDNYPKSRYAPESAWKLALPLYVQGKYQAFVQTVTQANQQFANTKIIPKLLFWQAKAYEKLNSPSLAVQTYQVLVNNYATTYYAFRAYGRLNQLKHSRGDVGWTTIAGSAAADYPPQRSTQLAPDAVLPELNGLANTTNAVLDELIHIGATEDILLLTKASNQPLPPITDSWLAAQAGDRSRSIRIVRDGMADAIKQGKPVSKTSLQLMYPVYFASEIQSAADRFQIDPWLVQSLMREESYFNEMAVSSSNARGLMQLLPTTAADVANWVNLEPFQTWDLFIPKVNILLGTRYLKYLHDTFSNRSMVSVGAYNGGPNAMKRWLSAIPSAASDPDLFVEQIPYEQSQEYIKKVYASYWNYNRLYTARFATNSVP
jgi:soluble lytic murein transglycosylase